MQIETFDLAPHGKEGKKQNKPRHMFHYNQLKQ